MSVHPILRETRVFLRSSVSAKCVILPREGPYGKHSMTYRKIQIDPCEEDYWPRTHSQPTSGRKCCFQVEYHDGGHTTVEKSSSHCRGTVFVGRKRDSEIDCL